MYRPPSGSKVNALAELETLIQKMPSKKVVILGDFNDDLFKADCQDFECIMYGNNMTPLISLATHLKPGCNPSLIDNILTNSIENLRIAGVLESGVSHHLPIFCFIDNAIPKNHDVENYAPKYDYCESNLNAFDGVMEEYGQSIFDYTELGFATFVGEIMAKIEDNFRVKSKSKIFSKIKFVFNPWITSGVVASVKKKHVLYKKMEKNCYKK